MSWYLCLSRLHEEKSICVKILHDNDIPEKGEELQILGQFRHKENAEYVKKMAPDIENQWETALFLTDETMHSYVSTPHGRSPD